MKYPSTYELSGSCGHLVNVFKELYEMKQKMPSDDFDNNEISLLLAFKVVVNWLYEMDESLKKVVHLEPNEFIDQTLASPIAGQDLIEFARQYFLRSYSDTVRYRNSLDQRSEYLEDAKNTIRHIEVIIESIDHYRKEKLPKENNVLPVINLNNYSFLSINHKRYEKKALVSVNKVGRVIKVEKNIEGKEGYTVSIVMLDGVHPVMGDNYTMGHKQMKVESSDNYKTVLRGWGADPMAFGSFAGLFSNYGITIFHNYGIV